MLHQSLLFSCLPGKQDVSGNDGLCVILGWRGNGKAERGPKTFESSCFVIQCELLGVLILREVSEVIGGEGKYRAHDESI